jgi:predicted esterase
MLDLGGFHWGDDILFDSNTGGLDPDAGFKESLTLLKEFIEETIVGKCGFAHRDVVMLGFGQGGMAALRVGGE